MPFLILVPQNRHTGLNLTDSAASVQVAFSVTNFRYVNSLPIKVDRGSDVVLGESTLSDTVPIMMVSDTAYCLPINYQDPHSFIAKMGSAGDYTLALPSAIIDPIVVTNGGDYSLSGDVTVSSITASMTSAGDYSLAGDTTALLPNAVLTAVGSVYPSDRDTNDPYLYTYDSMLLNFEGANGSQVFTDYYSKTILAAGTAQISTSIFKFGSSSCYFNGTGAYLYSNTPSSDLRFGKGDFTVEMFVYPIGFGTNQTLFDTRQTPSGPGVALLINASGMLFVYVLGAQAFSTVALQLNAWSHIALTRNGGTFCIYQNGTMVASLASAADLTDAYLTIGTVIDYRDTSATYKFKGYIDAIQVKKGVTKYTQVFTPPAVPPPVPDFTIYTQASVPDPLLVNTVVALDLNATTNFNDIKDHSFTAVGNAAISSTNAGRFNNKSVHFDGAGSYLYTSASTDLVLGSGDFGIEFWINLDERVGNAVVVSTEGDANALYVAFDAAGNYLCLKDQNTTYAVSSNIALGTWTHIYVQRVSGVSRIAVDGTFGANVNCTAAFTQSGMYVGGSSISVGFKGYLNQLRVAKAVRTTSNFKPFNSAFVNDDAYIGLVSAQLMMDDGAKGSSTFVDLKGHAITTAGNVVVDDSKRKSGRSSAFFTTGSSMTIADAADLELGSKDFTIEAWIDTASNQLNTAIFERTSASSFTTGAWTILFNQTAGGGKVFVYIADYSTSSPFMSGTIGVVNDGYWHHVAVTRKGSTFTLWVDGVSAATATWAGTIADIPYGIKLGNSTNFSPRDLAGNLDLVRITVGVARYTTGFSVNNADPYWPNTSLNLPLNDLITDLKGNPLIVSGDVTLSTKSKSQYANSALFNGGTITLPAGAYFEPGSGDFTVEFWYNPTSTNRQWFFSAESDFWFGLDIGSVAPGVIGMWASSNGTSWDLLTADVGGNGRGVTALSLNKWSHIVFSRNGNVWKLYINGVLDKSVTMAGTVTAVHTAQTKKLGNHAVSNYPVLGLMQDFRFTKVVDRYITPFTPPERLLAA